MPARQKNRRRQRLELERLAAAEGGQRQAQATQQRVRRIYVTAVLGTAQRSVGRLALMAGTIWAVDRLNRLRKDQVAVGNVGRMLVVRCYDTP